MNWKKRFLPSNNAEAGLLKIVGAAALIFLIGLTGLQINFGVVGLFVSVYIFVFYVVKFGNEVLEIYDIKPWIAYATAAMVIFPYSGLWVFCALVSAWIANLLVGKNADWFAFGLFALLVYLSSKLIKDSIKIVCAHWYGKYRKEVALDED